jgi:extracellular factor (EF) 3-hydroxypalmitic acid methyl ester biosynthesis protein
MGENGKSGPHEQFLGALGRERVFRERRFDRGKLKGLSYELLLRNGVKSAAGTIENFSSGGMALRFKQEKPPAEEGSKVEVAMTVDGREIYAGQFLVREVMGREDDVMVRGEFSGPPLDVERIFDLKMEADLRRRADTELDQTIEAYIGEHVTDAYRRDLERFKDFLRIVKEFLTDAERRIESERPSGAGEIKRGLFEHVARKYRGTYEDLCDRLYGHTRSLGDRDRVLYRIYTQRELYPIAIESPFCRQAFHKPLGYAGDYECMRLIIRDIDEGETLFEKFINHSVGMLKMARMVRSRGQYIRRKIVELCREREADRIGEGMVKIMSIACGPAEELCDLLEDESFDPAVPVHLYLVDQDDNALAYSHRKLKARLYRRPDRFKIHFLHVSIKQIIEETDLAGRIGGADFIYTMGMMDYMPDWIAGRIMDSLFNMLSPGGVMYIGNIRPGVETSWIAEFLFDWRLHYRSGEELLKLAGNIIDGGRGRVHMDAEEMGYNLFLVARKEPERAA